ncbi:MAG: branched-chain amino acid ABC transporter permease [Streptosporangiales bacterium]|nr:branched-chain amino acid ABC transporter permease [Streptosporangiales bacterium]
MVSQAVLTGLLLGGVYGLVAMGLTLIFGVLDIVNFAHGALMTVAMYGTVLLASHAGLDPYLTLLVTAPALFGIGMALQSGLINRTMGSSLANQLLLTLGIGLLIENVLLLSFGSEPRSVAVGYAAPLRAFGAVADLTRVIAFLGALGLAALLYLLLQRTRVGTAIRAVAANPDGAQLVGIDVRRMYVLTFALGTACAGAAGTLVAPFVTVEATTGELFNIIAFVVVVLGGMGNVVGALVGGLLIGLTEQLGGVLLPEQSPLLAVFVVFVLVLFLRPQGLFGRSS